MPNKLELEEFVNMMFHELFDEMNPSVKRTMDMQFKPRKPPEPHPSITVVDEEPEQQWVAQRIKGAKIDTFIVDDLIEFSKKEIDNAVVVYPDSVKVLYVKSGGFLVISWYDINPKVIDSLTMVGVEVTKRPPREGGDYLIDMTFEPLLKFHMAVHGQTIQRVRAIKGQIHFIRR